MHFFAIIGGNEIIKSSFVALYKLINKVRIDSRSSLMVN